MVSVCFCRIYNERPKQPKIIPNGIKPNSQKADLNFRPKIKKVDFQKTELYDRMCGY